MQEPDRAGHRGGLARGSHCTVDMANNDTSDPFQQLAELGRAFRHVQAEHEREAPQGARRRRQRAEMERLTRDFERVLAHWVHDDALRDAWRSYFRSGTDEPEQPRLAAPPLFRGRAQAGAVIELRGAPDGGYDLVVDGAVAEHHETPWHLEPERIEPIQIGEWTCTELFEAPDEAVGALRAFLARPGAEPPWEWARPLYEDGLIDRDFAVTPRGARRVAERRGAEPEPARRNNFCVLLVDAARARVLTLASRTPRSEPTTASLEDVADIANPLLRARDAERFSDTRPGTRREGPHGPRHGVSDRREGHRRDSERHFAEQVVRDAAQIWQRFPSCTIVVVANPKMLGLVRPAIARALRGPSPYDVVELSRDLTKHPAAAVHDALAEAELLPPRGRRPPVPAMRTPNPWQGG